MNVLIKAVTFDLWNTLISERSYADRRIRYLVNILNEQGITKDHAEIKGYYVEAHEYAHKVWKTENYRYVPAWERLEYILRRLCVDLPGDLKTSITKMFEEAILEDPPPLVEGARKVLETLNQNYTLGIICDSGITPGRVLRLVLKKREILDFFECTVFSDEIGYNKPHRLMFETALKYLDVKPSEALHVGDLLHTDIAGAKAVGMKAVWFDRGTSEKTGQYVPDFRISRLSRLLDVLKRVC